MNSVPDKLNQLTEGHGELKPAPGRVTGVLGDYVPNGFWKQVKLPFVWKG